MTMATVRENATERRLGFVVEEVISGCADGCTKPRVVAIPAADFGEVFDDLTEGLTARQHTGWEVLDGFCRGCNQGVVYRRTFVVGEVVRTTTLVTEEVIA
jgi:hypothetical protein